MKNLKKVIALVVALVFVMGTVGFAADTDTNAETTAYAKAEALLRQLNIMTGDENGDFMADKTLTREEAARIIYALAVSRNAAVAPAVRNTKYTDVASDNWASGYIGDLAGFGVNGCEIISGTSATTFDPKGDLTYDMVNKLITVTLGYYPIANGQGGWPYGYNNAAVQAKLYNNSFGTVSYAGSKTITRGEVAILIANALIAEPVVEVNFTTPPTYTKVSDTTYAAEKMNLAVYSGVVQKNDINSEKYDVVNKDDESKGRNNLKVADGVDMASTIGRDVTVFCTYTGNVASSTSSIVIEAVVVNGDRESLASTDDIKKYAFDGSKVIIDKKEYTVTTDTTYTVNGVVIDNETSVYRGSTKLPASTGNYIRDAKNFKATVYGENKVVSEIAIESYAYSQVTNIYTNTNKFYVESGEFEGTLDLNEDKDVLYVDGKESTVSALEEDDIVKIAVVPSNGSKDYNTITIVKDNVITGTATSKRTVDKKDAFIIDGKQYFVNVDYDTQLVYDVKLGKSAKFTLDGDNQIIIYDGETADSDYENLYIQWLGTGTAMNSDQVAFSTKRNNSSDPVGLVTKDKIGDGKVADAIIVHFRPDLDASADTGASKLEYRVPVGKIDDARDFLNEVMEGRSSLDDVSNATAKLPNMRFARATFAKSGVIDTIEFPASAEYSDYKFNSMGVLVQTENATSSAGAPPRLYPTDKVYVLVGKDKVVTYDMDYLKEDTTYRQVSNVPTKDADVVNVFIAGSRAAELAPTAIATSNAITEDVDGETYTSVEVLIKGEPSKLTTSSSVLSRVKIGDYFSYELDSSDEVESIDMINDFDTSVRRNASDRTVDILPGAVISGNEGFGILTDLNGVQASYVTAFTEDVFGTTGTVDITELEDELVNTVDIAKDVTIYVVNVSDETVDTGSNLKSFVSSVRAENGVVEENPYYNVIYTRVDPEDEDGMISEVIVYTDLFE